LSRRVSEAKLDDHFVIHGHVDNVNRMLAECHCLLIPSVWEGMPLVLLEAGAVGIPVIASPVGNIPSLLNIENGYIGETDRFRLMVTEVMDNYGEALIRARQLMHRFTIDIAFKTSTACISSFILLAEISDGRS
jgi:glycosyltransferase involved in cell wall biosynthesis